MKSWFLAARPKTLPAAIVPVWVGSAPALFSEKGGSWFLFLCTLFSCICIQIATNLFNDAIDDRKGADTKKRLGPRRVTATGLISSKAVMIGALWFCLAAALFSMPLIQERGWPIVGIGLVSLFFSYGYTGGPWPLAYRGMGEVFVIVFFGFIAVIGSYFVQTGEWREPLIWIVGLQCGLYSCVLIAINNLRDIEEDRETGKITLAVRFGKTFARWEIAFFSLMPVALWYFVGDLSWRFGVYCMALFFFNFRILGGIFRNEPGKKYNRYLALGAAQLMVFALFFTRWLIWDR